MTTTDDTPMAAEALKEAATTPVLLITGMSGAGRSSVLRALEDQGYEAVDNLPLTLLETLVHSEKELSRPAAIGVDIRTRDFGVARLTREIDRLKNTPGLDVMLIFIDCDDEVLGRRFTETRRRHPLAMDRPLADGIRDERIVLNAVRERADLVIDTTTSSLADLRSDLAHRFARDYTPGLNVIVTSFSYGKGLPRGADLVFDVRFLDNPYYDSALRPLTGLDQRVAEFIAESPGFKTFFDNLTELLLPLLPRYEREGKSYLTIAAGCTGGRHRSVYVAERLAATLRQTGVPVTVRHRDLSHR
ncbi:MAG: RNase adapter RapZ [Alphaproteobacteria bacterium]|nr:RNase adapter RapZ [Alphaproteobacteria bacterium]